MKRFGRQKSNSGMSNINMTKCDAMNDKTTKIPDSRFDRLGGDIERLSDTLQKIEYHELDKKIGLDLLIGFAENLIEHAKALNKPPIFNRATLTDEEYNVELERYEAERLARHLPSVKATEMTPEEQAEYFEMLNIETAPLVALAAEEEALAIEAMNKAKKRVQDLVNDNSCCVTFDIDADNDSIVAQVRQSECAGGEIDEAAVVEFNEIISEPLDSGSLSAEEKSRKEAKFLEGLFNNFISTAGDSSKGFSMMGRSAEVEAE